jgi:hypothetical protein
MAKSPGATGLDGAAGAGFKLKISRGRRNVLAVLCDWMPGGVQGVSVREERENRAVTAGCAED